ncbi:unnamed protein product [Mytilus edulis]|uniref:Uncharacterized protein n=1 Tax=Mytilus edulis TaxID=6550 RepID=A0A8S3PY73_MYTED|nr:unnamed protein product [Mytilus edulis]
MLNLKAVNIIKTTKLYEENRLLRNLTVVTAYFDIGTFPKGSFSEMQGQKQYEKWMIVYKYMQNPVLFYTDSEKYADLFRKIRNTNGSKTKVIIISRENLWAFKIKPKIAEIYSKPGYPVHYPATYMPEYTCVMHSKLEIVKKAIETKIFASKYYCWLDIGYFRYLVDRRKKFYLEVPGDFNDSKIGFTKVYDRDLEKDSAESILLTGNVWIGGGLILGKPDTLNLFETHFEKKVEYYLSQGLMNDDQRIFYAMYTATERQKHPINIDVQLYVLDKKKNIIPGRNYSKRDDKWFHLGYLMYNELE